MPGSPIPDDWDGETYQCYRVTWPSSEQYRSILLGQVSEPIQEDYWDDNTGTPSEASLAISEALNLTTENPQALVECEETVLIPAFRVISPETLTYPANQWSKIDFSSFAVNLNSPGYTLSTNIHKPLHTSGKALWTYTLSLFCTTGVTFYVGILVEGLAPSILHNRFVESGQIVLQVNWDASPSAGVVPGIFPVGSSATLSTVGTLNHFSGYTPGFTS